MAVNVADIRHFYFRHLLPEVYDINSEMEVRRKLNVCVRINEDSTVNAEGES
jgi:hypothetical protein